MDHYQQHLYPVALWTCAGAHLRNITRYCPVCLLSIGPIWLDSADTDGNMRCFNWLRMGHGWMEHSVQHVCPSLFLDWGWWSIFVLTNSSTNLSAHFWRHHDWILYPSPSIGPFLSAHVCILG